MSEIECCDHESDREQILTAADPCHKAGHVPEARKDQAGKQPGARTAEAREEQNEKRNGAGEGGEVENMAENPARRVRETEARKVGALRNGAIERGAGIRQKVIPERSLTL